MSFQCPAPNTNHHAGPQWAVQQVSSRHESSGDSCSVTLSLDTGGFDADQTLGFQPRVGQGLLQGLGSGHVPIAVAADSRLDRSMQGDAQGS